LPSHFALACKVVSPFEPFEQKEEWPLRLKRVVGDDIDSFSVFREMLQNADDAEATEIRLSLTLILTRIMVCLEKNRSKKNPRCWYSTIKSSLNRIFMGMGSRRSATVTRKMILPKLENSELASTSAIGTQIIRSYFLTTNSLSLILTNTGTKYHSNSFEKWAKKRHCIL
jgi:hypothetical protein